MTTSRFKSLVVATLLCFAAPAPVASAVPGVERQLTAVELRDIARRELLWCDTYQEATDDCDGLILMRLGSDGRVLETTTLLLTAQPRVQVFVADVDDIKGNRLCSKVATARLAVAFTLEGRAVSADRTADLRALFVGSIEDLDGKTICQTFFHNGDTHRLREEVTVDGERRHDLETTYMLKDGAEGFGLRPQDGGDGSSASAI
jgi:hypothetical protein